MCRSVVRLHVDPDFQLSFSLCVAMAYSAAEIQAAVAVIQGALDSGADLALYFGGWSPLQRRALAMSLGSADAAVAEAKASAKTTPPVKKAPAAPPAKPVGPTRPPAGWTITTVPLVEVSGADRLVPPPPGRHFAAASFPIIQEDENGATKVRRGEDWRRAGHNAAVRAHDVPTHHFVDDYVDIIRRVVELVGPEQAEALRIFGHDLLNAYRQWPVKEPAHSGTFLPAPHGVTMWFHMAMCFGAAASVWNFNRTADALQALKRVLLWVVSGHFVDDFNGVDLDELATGAFEGMAVFLEQLGLQTKRRRNTSFRASSCRSAGKASLYNRHRRGSRRSSPPSRRPCRSTPEHMTRPRRPTPGCPPVYERR